MLCALSAPSLAPSLTQRARRYGKGTLTTDGVGLLCACLSNLAERAEPPKAFVTTHFSEVLDAEFLPRTPSLAFYTMHILATVHAAAGKQPASTSSADEDIVFLYKCARFCVHENDSSA